MLDKLHALPAELGKPTILLADHGYFSAANVTACRSAQIEPLIVAGRQPHHPSLSDRFAEPPPAPENPTPLAAMLHHRATAEGKKLYALRKQIPKPVFGIIKSALVVPAVSAARPRQGARRMELGDHRLEYEADVRPQHPVRERRCFGSKPDKKFVDLQAAIASSWKTPCMASRRVW